MPAARAVKVQQTETEVAVLQVQVKNVENDISEIKQGLKDVSFSIKQNAENTHSLLRDMKESSSTAHKAMATQINALEKWRWMMMGAGIVIGSLGFETLAKLLK